LGFKERRLVSEPLRLFREIAEGRGRGEPAGFAEVSSMKEQLTTGRNELLM